MLLLSNAKIRHLSPEHNLWKPEKVLTKKKPPKLNFRYYWFLF